jgi:hypothetical protein
MTGKVKTPHGIGEIVSGKDGIYLVLFRKADYVPEEWLKISRANGPCVFRMYPESELEEIGDRPV